MNIPVASLAVVICVIIVVVYYYSISFAENFMTGYWISDASFADAAGISSMLLYIAPSEGLMTKTRKIYLVINNDIANQMMEISYGRGLALSPFHDYRVNVGITYLQDDGETPASDSDDVDRTWGNNVVFELNIAESRLRIYQGDKLHAILFKDGEISSMYDECD